ncbi:MAG: metallopeptidase family protein [Actinobacteria bacterium]|nr:metallopeptidase family protein [Actinomycetota bacterium]
MTLDVPARRFEELVAEALDGLPPWVHERLENVEVLVERRPPPGREDHLGLYEGIPLTQRGAHYSGVLPDRITLYRSNLVRGARTEEQLRARIRRTVVHEVAHFFGISDRRLREIDRY